jgi:hypothetical protein
MSDGGVKTQLDQIFHSLALRWGTFLYARPGGPPPLRRPAPRELIADAERLLGFPLPPLLREVYARVGNGGPALELAGLSPQDRRDGIEPRPFLDVVDEHFRQVELALRQPQSHPEPWPRGRLPISRRGDRIVYCVDCLSPEGPVWVVSEHGWARTHPRLLDYLVLAIARGGSF